MLRTSLRSLLLLPLLASVAMAYPQAGGTKSVDLRFEETTQTEFAEVFVRAFVGGTELAGAIDGAEVYINGALAGLAPWEFSALPPGTYVIEVRAKGFRPLSCTAFLQAKRRYELLFSLQRATGILRLELSPADAELRIDGTPYAPGSIELPVGTHRVIVRRFAYRDRSVDLRIEDGETLERRIVLEQAPFELSAFEASRKRFNPGNAGRLGETEFSFSVTAPGSGSLEIVDGNGTIVFSRDFPSFDTWDYRLTWTGRDRQGLPLPDGDYQVSLRATAAPGLPSSPDALPGASSQEAGTGETALSRSLRVSIDTRFLVKPLGVTSALPGLEHFPDPALSPMAFTTVEFGWRWANAVLIEGALGHSFGSAFFSLAGSLAPGGDAASGLRLGLLLPFPERSNLNAAFFGRGGYSFLPAGDDDYALEIGLSLSRKFGALELGLAPGSELRISSAASGFELDLPLRAGLWSSGARYQTGLSTELRFSDVLAAGFTPPRLRTALEGRLLFDPSPFLLTAAVEWIYGPQESSSVGARLGLGLLF